MWLQLKELPTIHLSHITSECIRILYTLKAKSVVRIPALPVESRRYLSSSRPIEENPWRHLQLQLPRNG